MRTSGAPHHLPLIVEIAVVPMDRIGRPGTFNATGKRGLNIPQVLEHGFGHLKCGVHGCVVSPGLIEVGDAVALLP